MQIAQAGKSGLRQVDEAEFFALVERIIDSGVLGKSRIYVKILRYLVECAVQNISPKEISIAIDVLERAPDFDISRDSIVRVYMYQVRTRLSNYFEKFGQNEKYLITIPRGQYGLSVVPNQTSINATAADSVVQDVVVEAPVIAPAGIRVRWQSWRWPLAAGACLALLVTLYLMFAQEPAIAPAAIVTQTPLAPDPVAQYGFWENILDDDMDVMIFIGDYYIFGEQDSNGRVVRMIRDFEVNSSADFDRMESGDAQARARYADLKMSYLPTGIASALGQITPFLSRQQKPFQIKMVSELDTADLVSHHVIYLGLLSGLSQFHDLMFAASGLYIGATYDELNTIATDQHYYSSYNFQDPHGSFRDYGIVSAFTAPRGNQFLMIAGMRDVGLVSAVEQAIVPRYLEQVHEALDVAPTQMTAFEAMYEVSGLQNTSFDSRLVHSQLLDSAIIWETRLVNPPLHR